MHSIDADVWVLTETNVDLDPSPAHTLIARSAAAPDRRADQGECWVAVWSRLPASTVDVTADPERVAAIEVKGVTVVGTVLPWLADSRHGTPGAAHFIRQLEVQSREWTALGHTLCVAGDFNQDLLPSGHYYGSAAGRQALRQTLQSASLDFATGEAGDMLAVVGRGSIDHICTRGLVVDAAGVWPEPGSLDKRLTDHYGFWVDVRLA